jgi:5-(carboxyamino)imidazole ribonucleotide synthase
MSEAKTLSSPVAPGGTIGILGGGQLGRMLALAAARLGLKTHIYSNEPDAPAFLVSPAQSCAGYEDWGVLKAFARSCDAVTFEFENIPVETLDFVAQFAPASPGAKALRLTQDRLAEKDLAKSLGIATPAYRAVNGADEAGAAFKSLGVARAVLKTRRMGYDGKGQAIVGSVEEARLVFESFKGVPMILETFVDFAFEASVVAARASDGAFAAYDPPENIHGDQILRRSIVPGRVSASVATEAKSIAERIAHALDFAGVLAVEFFVAGDGTLLFNEIAPRVHNSGHWTIEACAVSQFEQHVRVVAGWPLGDPTRHSDAVMDNIIGSEAERWFEFAARGSGLHLYGKPEIRTGRKMGHITTLSPKTNA